METSPEADFSIVYYNANSMDYSINLAYLLSEEFQKYVGTPPGDVGPGDVYVMRSLKVPGILGEPCMMSNKEREEWLRKDENLKKEAEAYKKAIVKLFSFNIPRLTFDATKVSERFEVASNLSLKKAGAFFDHTRLNAKITDGGTKIIVEVPEDVKPGKKSLFVYGLSEEGVYSFPLRKDVVYNPKVNRIEVKVLPKEAPKLPGSFYQITYELFHHNILLDYSPDMKVEGSVAAVNGNKIIIPYMGKDNVTVTITSGSTSIEVPLRFNGQKPVMSLILKDEKGSVLKVMDYFGGEQKIELQGFEPVTINEKLYSPVSFKEITLQRTLSGVFMGKTIAIAYEEEETDLIKSLNEKLELLGAETLMEQVKSIRDNFKAARLFNSKADVVVIFGNMERLKTFLKVPFITAEDKTLEEIIEALSGKIRQLNFSE